MSLRFFSLLLLAVLAAAPAAAQDRPTVIATTTILADVARNVAGDRIVVDALLPPDTDTHAYEPTTDDVRRVAVADALLEVGAGYETFIAELLENAGAGIPVYVASNGIAILPLGAHDHEHEGEAEHDHADEHLGVLGVDLECEAHSHEHEGDHAAESDHAGDDDHDHGVCDPHVWLDPLNGVQWARTIAAAFSELDPANAEVYTRNAEAYAEQLVALDAEIEALFATIPDEARVIVTNHEFLGYFAHRYGLEVVATVLPRVTTGQELDPQSTADLIALVQAENVRAIFAEVSANPELAQIIAQEAGVEVVTTLYTEALSAADGPAATYIDYLRFNAQTIADALVGA